VEICFKTRAEACFEYDRNRMRFTLDYLLFQTFFTNILEICKLLDKKWK